MTNNRCRHTLGSGLAKRLIFTNRTDLKAIAALAYTVERHEPGTTSVARPNEFDSAFSIQYSTFVLTQPPSTPPCGITRALSSPDAFV